MTRSVDARYVDPLAHIWLVTAAELGLQVRRSTLGYATTDGQGGLSVAPQEDLDPDDCLAQIILHELCHALVQGEDSFTKPDWGLVNDDDSAQYRGDTVREQACLRVQAALLRRYGLRRLLGPTTDFRKFYDALPRDPMGVLTTGGPAASAGSVAPSSGSSPADDPAIALAADGLARAARPPFRKPLERALRATADLYRVLPKEPSARYDAAAALAPTDEATKAKPTSAAGAATAATATNSTAAAGAAEARATTNPAAAAGAALAANATNPAAAAGAALAANATNPAAAAAGAAPAANVTNPAAAAGDRLPALWSRFPAPLRHKSGLPMSDGIFSAPSGATCQSCVYAYPPDGPRRAAWRCQRTAAEDGPGLVIDPKANACALHLASLDCQECGACCRHAYDLVPVGKNEPTVLQHPELILRRGKQLSIVRDEQQRRCAALAGPALGPYGCTIYNTRPSTCRDFSSGTSSCLDARRRVGWEF